jgi:hypothetical protein
VKEKMKTVLLISVTWYRFLQLTRFTGANPTTARAFFKVEENMFGFKTR